MSFEHVYGHQDDHRTAQDLPRLALLNTLVDCMAKDYLDSLVQEHCTGTLRSNHTDLEGEGWTIMTANRKLTGDPSASLHQHALGQPLKTHLEEKGLLAG